MTDTPPSAVKSADRVLDLFELLNQSAFGLSHTEIADHLGIPKSSLSQLLKNLVARGYVAYSPAEKLYQLGNRLEELVLRKSRMRDLGAIAQGPLERLAKETRESVFLNVRSGDNAKLVAREIGPQALVTILHVGEVVPLHRTAAGRAILAFLPRRTQDEYLARATFERFTSETVNDVQDLRKRLDEAAREGICVARDEFILGVTGISAPVLGENGEALASLTISMPTVRFNSNARRDIAAALTRECRLLAAQFIGAEPTAQ
ncbi:MAG: IclR family transcriptional regulator [Sphingomonadales bacterium]|nr:IclR family transcriptional regulator [Sphingomonadales bacterium]